MIEKIAVRKMLATYEKGLNAEIKAIEVEMERIKESFTTNFAREIWYNSSQYAELWAKREVLHKVYLEIMDMRCDEALED